MKVKMKKTAASPGNLYEAGKTYDLSDDRAKQFLENEACELVDPDEAAKPARAKGEKPAISEKPAIVEKPK